MKVILSNSKILFTLLITLISFSAFAQETTTNKQYEISDKALKAYVGEYIYDGKAEQGFDVSVSLSGDSKLMAEPTSKSQPITMLSARAEDKFELQDTDGLMMAFQKDEKGKIVSLTISRGSQTFTCIRKEGEE